MRNFPMIFEEGRTWTEIRNYTNYSNLKIICYQLISEIILPLTIASDIYVNRFMKMLFCKNWRMEFFYICLNMSNIRLLFNQSNTRVEP